MTATFFGNVDLAQMDFKRWMIDAAQEVIVVADSYKIGQVASAFVADISGADLLITDDGVDETVLGNLREDGLAVEVVSPSFKPVGG